MKKIVIVIGVLLAIVAVGGGSFWAGMTVGEKRVMQDPARFFQEMVRGQGDHFPMVARTPQPGEGAERFGGGIMGIIEAVEGDTLLVSTEEGEIPVHATDTTLIEKYMAVGVGDLEVGERVVVSGSRNDDGSVTARSIQSPRAFQGPQSDEP